MFEQRTIDYGVDADGVKMSESIVKHHVCERSPEKLLAWLLLRIESWTRIRAHEHLRHEFGDVATNEFLHWLREHDIPVLPPRMRVPNVSPSELERILAQTEIVIGVAPQVSYDDGTCASIEGRCAKR